MYNNYITLIDELDILISADLGDSPEADHLRDKIDIYWNRMSEEEREKAKNGRSRYCQQSRS